MDRSSSKSDISGVLREFEAVPRTPVPMVLPEGFIPVGVDFPVVLLTTVSAEGAGGFCIGDCAGACARTAVFGVVDVVVLTCAGAVDSPALSWGLGGKGVLADRAGDAGESAPSAFEADGSVLVEDLDELLFEDFEDLDDLELRESAASIVSLILSSQSR